MNGSSVDAITRAIENIIIAVKDLQKRVKDLEAQIGGNA